VLRDKSFETGEFGMRSLAKAVADPAATCAQGTCLEHCDRVADADGNPLVMALVNRLTTLNSWRGPKQLDPSNQTRP